MMKRILPACALAAALVSVGLARQQPAAPAAPAPVPQQPSQIDVTISGEPGAQVRLAVPDFIALSPDAETLDAAKTIGRVLWDDLNFEHEFALIPRDAASSVRPPRSLDDIDFDAWRELNADGVVVGTVQKTSAGVTVQVRLFNVRSRQSAPGTEYSGSIANPRKYAHTISDAIHKTHALVGVAQTKFVFASDRDGERLADTVEHRTAKELYISDYDGENQRRVTVGFHLNNFAEWSPDGRAIAYTSWRNNDPMQVFVQHLYDSLPLQSITKPSEGQNYLPAWSPDGSRIAFVSTRDGNPEIYVCNKDGSHQQRLTRNPSADGAPTWSPDGQHIAFTSDRTGAVHPQIWIMDADGLNQQQITHESYADRPTWSPAPFNEIAFASSNGPGNDIKIIDLGTRVVRQLTNGEGTNESPSYSPNGRHLAFTSSRSGKNQVFTINRMGQDLRQLTKIGNNERPNWSPAPGK